jgi:hypothetical protein
MYRCTTTAHTKTFSKQFFHNGRTTMKHNEELIGRVPVYSSAVVIGDPVLIYDSEPAPRDGDIPGYLKRREIECIDLALSPYGAGTSYHGVVAGIHQGDGEYPVVAVRDDEGNIERLIIEFKNTDHYKDWM